MWMYCFPIDIVLRCAPYDQSKKIVLDRCVCGYTVLKVPRSIEFRKAVLSCWGRLLVYSWKNVYLVMWAISERKRLKVIMESFSRTLNTASMFGVLRVSWSEFGSSGLTFTCCIIVWYREQWALRLFNPRSIHLSLHSGNCWPLKGYIIHFRNNTHKSVGKIAEHDTIISRNLSFIYKLS